MGRVRESKCSPMLGMCYTGEGCSYVNGPVMFASDHFQIKAWLFCNNYPIS